MMPQGIRVTLYLPALSDSSVRQWHRAMRVIPGSVEDHYQQQLARAYGWAPSSGGDEEEDEDEDEEEDDDWNEITL